MIGQRFLPRDGAALNFAGRILGPWIACASMLGGFSALAVSAGTRFCGTFDEPAHLAAGYAMLTRSDYRLDTMHGNLSQRIAALPLLAIGPAFDPIRVPAKADHWDIAVDFLYRSGNDPQTLLLAGRAAIAAVTVGLGALVYAWSTALAGPAGGRVSLAVLIFHPLVLGHGALITSDATVSLLFLAAVGGLWRLLQRGEASRLAMSILAVGLLLTAKMSAVLIVPMATLLVAGRIIDGRPWPFDFGRKGVLTGRLRIAAACAGLVAVHVVGVAAVVWAAYGFRYAAAGACPGLPELDWQPLLSGGDWKMSLVRLAREARLFPEAFLHGLTSAFTVTSISPAFLDGRFYLHGSPWYFPLAFIYKTPLAFWLVVALAAGVAGRGLVLARDRRQAMLSAAYDRWPLFVILAVYGVVAMRSHFNIGLRHVMPMLPPLAILLGPAAAWRLPAWKWSRAVPAAAVVLFAAESLLYWPNYLAYFNPLAGGMRHAHCHLVDSNLDWGQDLPALRRWLDDRGINRPPTCLAYFGTAIPERYDIRCHMLPSYPPRPSTLPPNAVWPAGTYCISASLLQGVFHVRAYGPWSADREVEYNRTIAQVSRLLSPEPIDGLGDTARKQILARKLGLLDELRLARLCAWLRRRTPDDSIGGSILIFRLSRQQLDDALLAPLAPAPPGVLP